MKKRYQNNHDVLSFKNILIEVRRGCISFPSKLHKRIHWNNVNFLCIEITLKKVYQKSVDFPHIEITSNKVHWNDLDFLPIKITSKKYVEMTWKFVDVFFLTYHRNIDIKSNIIRRGVPNT